jgi:hypothetical protein
VVKPGRLVRTADRAVAGYRTSLSLCVWVMNVYSFPPGCSSDRSVLGRKAATPLSKVG